MAGTHLTITVDADEVLAAHGRQAVPDTGPLMPRLGEYLQRSTEQRFKTQTAPDGTPWAPLNERYAKRKKQNKDKILTLRGYLRRYIHYQVQDDQTVEVGSNQKYAAIHQHGGSIAQAPQSRKMRFRKEGGRVSFAGRRHKNAQERWVTRGAYQVEIPARPYLGISSDDATEIREIIRAWLVERTNG